MKLHFVLPVAALGLIFSVSRVLAASAPRVTAADIRPERELLITHPSVVDSEFAKYSGPWSFGFLVEQISGTGAPAAVRGWLQNYADGNKDAGIPARELIRSKVIEPWQKRDGFDPSKGETWVPKLANAPFRLLAIVNRMDLALGEFVDVKTPVENAWTIRGKRDELVQMASLTGQEFLFNPNGGGTGGYGGGGGGFTRAKKPTREEKKAGPKVVGEGRLVFGAVDSEGRALEGGWTIIFEYSLDSGRVSHSQAWIRLRSPGRRHGIVSGNTS